MADGGDAHFCSGNRAHNTGCQYFEDGGEALDLGAPVQQQPSASQGQELDLGDPVLDLGTPVGYDSPTQKVATGVEGVAQGLLGPLAPILEQAGNPKAMELGLTPDEFAEQTGIDRITKQDIAARAEANPGIHAAGEVTSLLGSALLGTGQAGAIASAAEHFAPDAVTMLGKLGSATIKSAIESGTLQGSDEISKYLLGQNGDPSAAASAILVSGALGAGLGLMGKSTSELLKQIPNLKLGDILAGLPTGIGASVRSDELKEALPLKKLIPQWKAKGMSDATIGGIKLGEKIGNAFTANVYGHGLGLLGAERGYEENGFFGALYGGIKGELLGSALGFGITKFNSKAFIPMLSKILSSNSFEKVTELLNKAPIIAEGVSKIEDGVGNLFKIGTQQGVNANATEKERQKLHQFISKGTLNQQIQNQLHTSTQGFSDGGMVFTSPNRPNTPSNHVNAPANPANMKNAPNINNVTGINEIMSLSPQSNSTTDENISKPVQEAMNKPVLEGTDAIATHYPELGMMLGAAKTRVNNYLNSQRPVSNAPKLAFDSEPMQVEQKRTYDKALNIAIQPLSVLNHIKEGTLLPEHIKHLNGLYPELKDHLDKKITEKITEAQMKGEKPSYQTIKGLSMFLGTPLEGSLTPANIQAAQGVYAAQAQQQQTQIEQTKPKKNTSKLSKVSDEYRTADQAAQARSQRPT